MPDASSLPAHVTANSGADVVAGSCVTLLVGAVSSIVFVHVFVEIGWFWSKVTVAPSVIAAPETPAFGVAKNSTEPSPRGGLWFGGKMPLSGSVGGAPV